MDRINRIRSRTDLPVLRVEAAAARSAQIHADELASRLSLSHLGLDGSRVNDRYRNAGGTGLSSGENLGAGDSVERISAAWMQSPSHRENLLNPQWTAVGIGIHQLDSGRIIAVVVFSASRWETEDLSLEDGIPVLRGIFYPEKGRFPQDLFLQTEGDKFRPSSARRLADGSLALTFHLSLSTPAHPESLVSALLVYQTGDELHSSDLLLLRPHR